VEGDSPPGPVVDVVSPEPTVTKSILEQHPYLSQPFSHFKNLEPLVAKVDDTKEEPKVPEVKPPVKTHSSGEYVEIDGQRFHVRSMPAGYVQNEEQQASGQWTKITEEEYLSKANEKNNTNNAS
jgi:hypothetical protein